MKQLLYITFTIGLLVACAADKLDDVELKINEFENPPLPFITVDRATPINSTILRIDLTVHEDRFPSSIIDPYIGIIGSAGDTVVTEKRSNIFIRKLVSGTSNYRIGLFEKETRKISSTIDFSYP